MHVSTDYVYSGDHTRREPYGESDPPSPQGVYARTKLEGEHLAAECPQHLIIRTCGLYGMTPKRNNFVETMLRLGQEGRSLRVVDDQHCTPSYTADVASAMLYLIHSGATGIYHVVNGGQTTWIDLRGRSFDWRVWTFRWNQLQQPNTAPPRLDPAIACSALTNIVRPAGP